MTPPTTPQRSPARQIALIVLFITLMAFGFSASLTLTGRWQQALAVCGGAVLLSAVVLVFGALIVALSKPSE